MNPFHQPLWHRIVSKETVGTDLLRIVVCAILFTHGAYRLSHGEARGLGELLREESVPAGLLVAYLVCIAETAGTVLLAMRFLVLPISLILSLIYFTGIMMFNRHNGFFLVGAGEGGWEYNALLITCLLVTAWENRTRKLF
jgi:putative oxidoreductase